MKLTYTGKPAKFPPLLQKKLELKFSKLSKMIEKNGEREAHVFLSQERHLHKAEITINCFEHSLVGIGSDPDLFASMHSAIDKLDKQVVKLRTRWRDTKRDPKASRAKKESWGETAPPAGAGPADAKSAAGKNTVAKSVAAPKKKVFRVNHEDQRKPMTLEEAMIEMERVSDYLVYHDADKNCVSVLIRRPDGHFDLIES